MLIAIIILALMFFPFVASSYIKNGKLSFSLSIETDRLNEDIKLKTNFVVNNNSEGVSYYPNSDMNDKTTDVLFETSDWILDVRVESTTLSRSLVHVTYQFSNSSTMERDENRIASFFVKLFLNYTDKFTGLKETSIKTLTSEVTDGEISFIDYIESADELKIPIASSYAFDKLEITNKVTNSTIKGYTYYDPQDYYVQDQFIAVSYQLEYSFTEEQYISIFSSEINTVKAGFVSAIMASIVAAVVSFFRKQGGKLDFPPPPPV